MTPVILVMPDNTEGVVWGGKTMAPALALLSSN